jgi:hypothetical protein
MPSFCPGYAPPYCLMEKLDLQATLASAMDREIALVLRSNGAQAQSTARVLGLKDWAVVWQSCWALATTRLRSLLRHS